MTRKACIIGWPVQQSLSPIIHTYWLAKHGIDGEYGRLALEPERLVSGVEALKGDRYAGFNVTMPHKQTIMPLLDSVDELANRIGAVNTVYMGEDGRYHGTNTDGYGFLEHLKQSAKDRWNRERPALILGAGGAARAAVVALLDAGLPRVTITNRSQDKAEKIAEHIADNRISIIPWSDRDRHVADFGLIANTTSLGMIGSAPLEMSLEDAQPTTVIYDIVYKPLSTTLLQAAERHGLTCVDGLGMLMHQAVPGFKLWFDQGVTVDDGLQAATREAMKC